MYYSKKFQKFKNINHCFFQEKVGVLRAFIKVLIGQGSRDNKKNVSKNLNFVSKKIKINKKKLYLMYQTHSNKVIVITKKNKI